MKIGELEFTPQDVASIFSIGFKKIKETKDNFYIPKNIKNKIGIVVALRTEKDDEKIRLENDLISELNTYLKNSKNGNEFNIVKFSQDIINKIQDNQTAYKYLAVAKAHFIIYGSVAKRKIQGKDSYIFKLHGMVRHVPIPQLTNKIFSKEFSELLPYKVTFAEDDEALGFELTEHWVRYVIKYIIAIAAFVSGDLSLAKDLYLELETEIGQIGNNETIPVIHEIKRRLPARLSEVMLAYINFYYKIFTINRDVKFILKTESYLDKLKLVDPDNYAGHLSRAILFFFKNDLTSAIAELANINNSDVGWRYSLGFLLAYQGDINGALQNYQKTFYKPQTSNIIDIEIFLSEVLNKEPSKIQLNFFRGLINYKMKQDYKLAKEDFDFLVNHKDSVNFTELTTLANKYLGEINSHIGI